MFLLCSWRRQPRLWLVALVAALLLMIVIVVCVLRIGSHPPRFVAGPAILATAGYSFDTSMAVDHSGFVYYTVIPSEMFLDELDPGSVPSLHVLLVNSICCQALLVAFCSEVHYNQNVLLQHVVVCSMQLPGNLCNKRVSTCGRKKLCTTLPNLIDFFAAGSTL